MNAELMPTELGPEVSRSRLAPVRVSGRPPGGWWQSPAELLEDGVTVRTRYLTQRSYAPLPSSVGSARDFAVDTAQRWGLADLAEDVRLVVSELVGNACRHATSEEGNSSETPIVVQLRLLSEEKAIVCMIADNSDREPARVDAHHFTESGRGLALVAAFSTDWGWQRREKGGKVVWAVCGGQE